MTLNKHDGTIERPIVDSAMTITEAFAGLNPDCPKEIREQQQLVTVMYYSFDGNVHRGQLVIATNLENDIQKIFALALQQQFPIRSVIPISHPRFRRDGHWDDLVSMAANNTSAFNYRAITVGMGLSNHAYGRAIDINPLQNPYIKGDLVLPPGAVYIPTAKGTLTADHIITKTFLRLDWDWGGTWDTRQDYQHFEKPTRDQK